MAGGIRVFAVTGTNTVSFGIDANAASRAGLLGFAVERIDPTEDERFFMSGFKVFPSVVPSPDASTVVSTFEHPIQSLVWDDFTGKPGRPYTYRFHPLAGTPKNLDRSRPVVEIDVETEPLHGGTHDVFFNRGVASSQRYARRFGNLRPDRQPTERKRKEALAWLSRDLDEAMLRFIRSARPGDAIRGCFYEFTYRPVLDELKKAIDQGVDVKLVVDLKVNEHTSNERQPDGTTKAVFHASDPRLRNLEAIRAAGIPDSAIVRRESRRSSIAHNKFMVLLTGAALRPTQVWTGSTNLTDGGVHGQANVGHWIRDRAVARSFLDYWNLLEQDPGGRPDDSNSTVRSRNAEFYDDVATLTPVPALDAIPPGTTPVFSPRKGLAPLDLYVELASKASSLACMTFAFSVPAPFKAALAQNTTAGPLCFLLLEKEDRPNSRSTTPFVRLRAAQNVYQASGSEITTPLGQWVVETDNRKLGPQLACRVHALQVPAARPARRRPDRRDGFGELQRGVDHRQRREHGDRARRPPGRRHLLHRVQSPLQPLLLPSGRRAHEPRCAGRGVPDRCGIARARGGRPLAAEVRTRHAAHEARRPVREDGGRLIVGPEPTPLTPTDPEERTLRAGGSTPVPAARRRARIGWVVGGVSALVLVGVAVTWQADANRGYDEARSGLASSAERVQSERDELAGVIAEHEATLATAGAIADAATADVVDPAALEAFEDAVQSSDRGGRRGERRTRRARGRSPRRVRPSTVLAVGRARIPGRPRARPPGRPRHRDRPARPAGTIRGRDGDDGCRGAGPLRVHAGGGRSPPGGEPLGADPRCGGVPVGDGRGRRSPGRDGRESSDALIAYVAAATQLRASNQAELEEKAGPLLDRRVAAEAFARSLAGGILLDFDWAPIVNGYGTGGTVGGLATWTTDHGGSANITLSDSVAEQWPSPLSQALVAHEVGHAVSVRCSDRFDAQSRAANEAWATAWAISRGFTGDGNGVSIYGPPPQELIDAAATCG